MGRGDVGAMAKALMSQRTCAWSRMERHVPVACPQPRGGCVESEAHSVVARQIFSSVGDGQFMDAMPPPDQGREGPLATRHEVPVQRAVSCHPEVPSTLRTAPSSANLDPKSARLA